MSELVTKEFLKAFGDKCKKIFKPLTTVVNAPDDNEYKYLIINTDLPWLDTWVVNIDISGKGFTNTYNNYYGDIKFFGNISNLGNWEGRGYSLVDNEVIGILIDNYSSGVGYKTRFVILFFEPIKLVAIDIINYLGDNTSNVNINSVEFISSLGGNFSYAYILGNIDYQPSTIGKIIRLELLSKVELFLFKLPKQNDDSDLDGEYINIPEDTTQIDSVNDSKWAKYLKTKHSITLSEGDLKETIISFGGDNNTEISVSPLEINNSVLGNTEGEWFGKVQVNSKGLVTAVAPEESLLVATDTILGGIQIGYEENTVEKNYPVYIDENNKAYVHVPWNDTDTWNKVADNDNLGLIKLGYIENDSNYPVKLDSDNKAYVTIPLTKCEAATDSQLGSIKVGYNTTDKNYAVLLDSDNNAYVNVPWECNGDTYDKASITELGLVKLCDSLPLHEKPLKLKEDGSAYIDIGVNPVEDLNCDLENSYVKFYPSYGTDDYYHINIVRGSQEHIYVINFKEYLGDFKGIKLMTWRIDNTSDNTVSIKIVNDVNVNMRNMFDSSITSDLGISLLSGKTLELVFTFWNTNDISFNGGFSV